MRENHRLALTQHMTVVRAKYPKEFFDVLSEDDWNMWFQPERKHPTLALDALTAVVPSNPELALILFFAIHHAQTHYGAYELQVILSGAIADRKNPQVREALVKSLRNVHHIFKWE
jgi:hypothetical protein